MGTLLCLGVEYSDGNSRRSQKKIHRKILTRKHVELNMSGIRTVSLWKSRFPYNSELISGASKPLDVILESSSIKDQNGVAQEVRETE